MTSETDIGPLCATAADTMRSAFRQQLDALTITIAEMCALAGQSMQDATQALLQADVVLAEGVNGEHHKIVLNGACAEQDAFSLLALQAPVAGDLRAVVASLQNVADAEVWVPSRGTSPKSSAATTPPTRYPRKSTVISPKWAASRSISATTQKTLCNPRIHARPPNCCHDDDAMDDLHRRLFSLLRTRLQTTEADPQGISIPVDRCE